MRRDLMGYGLNPPHIAWPGGAKLAVSIVVNFEEGAEMALEAGDAENERIGEVISVVPPGRRDFGQEQIFSYGMRAGLARFLEALDRHGREGDLVHVRPRGGAHAGSCRGRHPAWA